MCIAIVKPKNHLIAQSAARNCFSNNPDGAGFAYPDDGVVKIEKGFFTFESFWARFNEVQTSNNCDMLVHFRIATAGNVDKRNCHPWRINEKAAMIHNGTIQEMINKNDPSISDSGNFAKVLSFIFKRDEKQFKDNWLRWFIRSTIGNGNKVAILNEKGEVVIYNEEAGTWENGIWYSNHSFSYSKEEIEEKWLNFFNSTPHQTKKTKRIYYSSDSNNPLTSQEIGLLCKKHKCKVSKLVEAGVLICVPLDEEEVNFVM